MKEKKMHIPDGFISPITALSALIIQGGLFTIALSKTKKFLHSDETALTFVSSMAAFSFLVMMLNIPIPGGTSGHATGIGALAILLGPWVAFVCLSVVLLFQAIVFGDGGVLAWGANALAMGFIGAWSAHYMYKVLTQKVNEKIALFASGYVGMVASSIMVALFLGIQPYFNTGLNGQALYFPLGLDVTFPAVVGSHIVAFGMIEGLATVLVAGFITQAYHMRGMSVPKGV